jgi:hypothetical protein
MKKSSCSKMSFDNWNMISSLAAVAGVLASAFTFAKSFSRMKRSEQVKMAFDISNNLTATENQIIKAGSTGENNELYYAYMQHLNNWEWFSFLVNKNQITIKDIIEYYKPAMLKDYESIFKAYPHLMNDNTKYKEFKSLYEKLKED